MAKWFPQACFTVALYVGFFYCEMPSGGVPGGCRRKLFFERMLYGGGNPRNGSVLAASAVVLCQPHSRMLGWVRAPHVLPLFVLLDMKLRRASALRQNHHGLTTRSSIKGVRHR